MTTKPLTLATVRDIKEEAEKATQGPWRFILEYPRTSLGGTSKIGVPRVLAGRCLLEGFIGDSGYDANFAAASRANVPALCDTIETLVEALRRIVNERDFTAPEKMHWIAQDVLSTIDPPSDEAQTEGDGG